MGLLLSLAGGAVIGLAGVHNHWSLLHVCTLALIWGFISGFLVPSKKF